jgi:hypothetical protein
MYMIHKLSGSVVVFPIHSKLLHCVYTAARTDQCDIQPPPQATEYGTTGPNTGPGLPHPTGHAPTRNAHFIVIDKQDTTRYMLGSLPSAHTSTEFV